MHERISALIERSGIPYVTVVYRDLSNAQELQILPDHSFHAASTMKVPVMMEAYRQVHCGRFGLDDEIPVVNEFRSIVDGSPYTLSVEDDSEAALYDRVGQNVPVRELIELMITVSSNLATNILVDYLGVEEIRELMDRLGASGVEVRRGVEDGKAFAKGLNNEVTARDLSRLFEALAQGEVVSPEASREMLEVLRRQQHNEAIPAGLPPATVVAHKTGWNTDIYHDAGLVFEGDGQPAFALTVLTKGAKDRSEAQALVSEIARNIYAARQEGPR